MGQKFGSLTVIAFAGVKEKRTYWRCVCDCGVEKDIGAAHLRNTKSCGKKDCLPFTVKKDLTNQKFGYLTAIKYELRNGWLCECECGETTHFKPWPLISGHAKSCGCKSSFLSAEKRILPHNQAQINLLYRRYVKSANKRNLSFQLTIGQLKEFICQNCFYCGSLPSKPSRGRKFLDDFRCNGIDRKNNALGYSQENSIPCCKICNWAKSSMDYDEFLAWLDQIALFRRKN